MLLAGWATLGGLSDALVSRIPIHSCVGSIFGLHPEHVPILYEGDRFKFKQRMHFLPGMTQMVSYAVCRVFSV